MDAGHVVRQLRAAGADAEITTAGLLVDGAPARVEDLRTRPATPSDLSRIVETSRRRHPEETRRPVVSARRASPRTISWLQAHPEVTLVVDDRVVHEGVVHLLDADPPPAPRRKGPRPYARFAVARVLLTGASRDDQVRLAERAGVTQGSVSNALRRLPDVRDPGLAFDELVRDHPEPGGQTFYLWSEKPVRAQAEDFAGHGALLSGDIAADRLAPWRVPEHLVAYVEAPVDLSADGYVLATPDDYTAVMVAPADSTLRATAAAWGRTDVADPIIAASDVLRTATTGDHIEAIEKLRDAVIRRFHETRHA